MKFRIIILLLFQLAVLTAPAQNRMEQLLNEIALNNKTIRAAAELNKVQHLELRTGRMPANPFVEYDYLNGSPASAGDQHDFVIAQSFDFPTVYRKKSQLAAVQANKATHEYHLQRQNILLEAKKAFIAVIYHTKLQGQLQLQISNASRIVSFYESRLEKGDATILQVSRAQMQSARLERQVHQNEIALGLLNAKLTALNGGIELVIKDSQYFVPPALPDFEQLQQEYEAADPVLKMNAQERFIAEKNIEVSRNLWLPKLELGYKYQGILGQTYNGIHTGITIPFLEHRHAVNLQKLKLQYTELRNESERISYLQSRKNLYDEYLNLKKLLITNDRSADIASIMEKLLKALNYGEITATEYFEEINFYSEMQTEFLQTERDFYLVVTELLRHQL